MLTPRQMSSTLWLHGMESGANRKIKIYCFGHAGSNSVTYLTWQRYVGPELQLCPVLLPGHGARFSEPLSENLLDQAASIAQAISERDDIPFAVFGHSMGAILGFEVLRILEKRWGRVAQHFFVAASSAPQHKRAKHKLDSPEDVKALVTSLNGTPEELLRHPEAMQLLLPVLRADLCALDRYVYHEGGGLVCPITAFMGMDDPTVDLNGMKAWGKQSAQFQLHLMSGDHFSILMPPKSILDRIARDLLFPLTCTRPNPDGA